MKAADVLRASAASLLSSSESLDRAVSEVEAVDETQEGVNGSSASSPDDLTSLSFEDLPVQVLATMSFHPLLTFFFGKPSFRGWSYQYLDQGKT